MRETAEIIILQDLKRKKLAKKLVKRALNLPSDYKPTGYKRFGTAKPSSRLELIGAMS